MWGRLKQAIQRRVLKVTTREVIDRVQSLEEQYLVERISLLADEMAQLRARFHTIADITFLLTECVLRDRFGVGEPPWASLKRASGLPGFRKGMRE